MHAVTLLRYARPPLRGGSAALIVVFALLLVLAARGGLLGLPLAFITLSWFFKYGFALLDAAADGEPNPPVLSYEMVNPFNEQRPLVLAVLAASFWIVTGLLEPTFGAHTVKTVRVVGALLAPAAIAVLIVSTHALHVLNPWLLARVAIKLGRDYLVVLGVVLLLLFFAHALDVAPVAGLPLALPLGVADGLTVAALMYGWLLIFALIGGAVFEHREALGYEPAHSPEREAERAQLERRRELDRFIDRVYAEARGNSRQSAWETIEAHVRSSADPIAELQALLERTAAWPDRSLRDRLAHELIDALLRARRTGEALDVYRGRVRNDGHFRPLNDAQRIRLAELARAAGDRAAERCLLDDR